MSEKKTPAEVIAAGIRSYITGGLDSGHRTTPIERAVLQQIDHDADRIAEWIVSDGFGSNGIEVIQLPEPNSRGRWASSRSFSDPGYLDWSVGVNGSVPFASARRGKGDESKAAADHAEFAAALLAAARATEVS